MKASALIPLITAIVFTGSSCAQNNTHIPVAGKGKTTTMKGFATGRITDEHGNPLSNVTVYAGHTVFYNTNVTGKTNADGRYKLNIGATRYPCCLPYKIK